MNSERREQLRRKAKADWARKTLKEKQASMNGLAAEIGENAALALRGAFERASQGLRWQDGGDGS